LSGLILSIEKSRTRIGTPAEALKKAFQLSDNFWYGETSRQRNIASKNNIKQDYLIGCSKMVGCKAREAMRNEAYFCVRRNDT